MKTRETPHEIPAHLDYYAATLPGLGDVRVVAMRFTDQTAYLKERERLAAEQAAGGSPSATIAGSWGLLGAVVGLGWAHPAVELETERARFGSLREYGIAVLEELETAGVPAQYVAALGRQAAEAQVRELGELAEAAAMVPFSKARRGGPASSSSEQGPSTAGTPGRRTGSKRTNGAS
jgi:hypothetical protein